MVRPVNAYNGIHESVEIYLFNNLLFFVQKVMLCQGLNWKQEHDYEI